ncbi:MAG: hypothetical protein JOZ50_08775 [Candidatus Eremiobacteraeota bacterium]|nr:hypothetical protein [Candidatus Eremiobacteraeota bacterium]
MRSRFLVASLLYLTLVLFMVARVSAQPPELMPGVKSPIDKYGSDYTSTTTTHYNIPQTFSEGNGNNQHLITAWKSYVGGLGNVAIIYFRITTNPITDKTLNAQVAQLWDYFKNGAQKGTLDVLIFRGVNSDSTKMYNYIYRKGSDDKWFRNRDGDYVDTVIQTGI